MLWYSFAKLALESSNVIASRMALIASGKMTPAEAQRMFTEKMSAAMEAGAILATGGDADKVLRRYRRHVKANARRLGRQK